MIKKCFHPDFLQKNHRPFNNDEFLTLLNFQVEKCLGKGTYGSVFRVKRLTDGKQYAMKQATPFVCDPSIISTDTTPAAVWFFVLQIADWKPYLHLTSSLFTGGHQKDDIKGEEGRCQRDSDSCLPLLSVHASLL